MLSICIFTISLLYPLETGRGPLIGYNGSLDQGSSKESILVEINRVLLEKMKTKIFTMTTTKTDKGHNLIKKNLILGAFMWVKKNVKPFHYPNVTIKIFIKNYNLSHFIMYKYIIRIRQQTLHTWAFSIKYLVHKHIRIIYILDE